MSNQRRTTALLILDGFGYSETSESNAIAAAETPVWDKLWEQNPHSLISGSGIDVGLPDGQMGNSEVGHMNLGAGRVVYQDFTRITKAIADASFFTNPTLTEAVDKAITENKAVHILGLLSPGGVHSHEDHILAMIDLAAQRGAQAVYVHAFLDGRDTPPRSAETSLKRIEAKLSDLGVGRIASLIGRYFAMDRDNRWDRVAAAYNMLTLGTGDFSAEDPVTGLQAAYARSENDEFVKATIVTPANQKPTVIGDGDAVVFMNFRADRARQLTRAFVEDSFSGFERISRPNLAGFVMLTQYAADIPAPCAFPPASLKNTLGEYLASLSKTQLRIAETEKYAHVTFFFSGGEETPYKGETRILVNSPDVATYDLKPEMSAPEVTDKLVEAIISGKYDLVVCNYANGDMVGHTGVFDAAVKAVECLDECIGRILKALEQVNGQCLITADHGNVEQMSNEETGQAHTAHTCEPVPLVYAGPKAIKIKDRGILSDIAPTILSLMELPIPEEMTGKVLVEQAN
ncbi:2,3-bisphosphoglycerate-independent phosphoglycerate mutase [Endozoicomonas sp. SM1973]|uniref:2,3-bisphosphoglycerate-independent phosphoglycerate mutase n=1 Tax=Spartinivicinus marinus TaxID=2994442 RepID=A0A853I608_9GAMM|nr:2,3-bisphosphoglycerate-independent phosphoglycerate mutase [Spartinivicinus marinus]MCX4027180.1 2,3-bisphosphoglycerate-independent phosphoglycerate mutase [Spartinivicinus marinus]NYZ66098.1 2,3-bisphosphoglycerate-independent phosphoglycerate mutase [Spartinivicinus marinus]